MEIRAACCVCYLEFDVEPGPQLVDICLAARTNENRRTNFVHFTGIPRENGIARAHASISCDYHKVLARYGCHCSAIEFVRTEAVFNN